MSEFNMSTQEKKKELTNIVNRLRLLAGENGRIVIEMSSKACAHYEVTERFK